MPPADWRDAGQLFGKTGSVFPLITRNAGQLAQVADEIRLALKLYDFDVFASNRRALNESRGVEDLARRTGRTWRGLVAAFARCVVDRCAVLKIRGGSDASEQAMLSEATELAEDLRIAGWSTDYPKVIWIHPKRAALAAPPGEILYVDHHYFEVNDVSNPIATP